MSTAQHTAQSRDLYHGAPGPSRNPSNFRCLRHPHLGSTSVSSVCKLQHTCTPSPLPPLACLLASHPDTMPAHHARTLATCSELQAHARESIHRRAPSPPAAIAAIPWVPSCDCAAPRYLHACVQECTPLRAFDVHMPRRQVPPPEGCAGSSRDAELHSLPQRLTCSAASLPLPPVPGQSPQTPLTLPQRGPHHRCWLLGSTCPPL